MRHIIIGTAGHVDHGKTALIQALTGINTDRLKEEQVRGISIDLGFASLALGEDLTAGIVDVPGHERFLKNMLAGTGGIDLALMVIAADEGVMPQTREHLSMLHYFGIANGVTAITKIDKVDEEWLEFAEDEIRKELQGTFLENGPLCRVSAATGAGLQDLKMVLQQAAQFLPVRDRQAPFRMWIDRSFSIKGHGTVVTGSVLTGTVEPGNTLRICPDGVAIRVRGLQTHSQRVASLGAGERAAINIAGASPQDLGRGMFVCSEPYGEVSACWDIWTDLIQPMKSGTRVRLHIGTGEQLGRLYTIKNAAEGLMRFQAEKPFGGAAGDRAILRLYSPQTLLGGAILVATAARGLRSGPRRQVLAQAIRGGCLPEILYAVARDAQRPVTIRGLAVKSGFWSKADVDQAAAYLIEQQTLADLGGGYYAARETLVDLTRNLLTFLKQYHCSQTCRFGPSREVLRQSLDLEEKALDAFLSCLARTHAVMMQGGEVALPEHAAQQEEWLQNLLLRVEALLAPHQIIFVNEEFWGRELSLDPYQSTALQEYLLKKELLIHVGDFFVYRKTMQYIAERVQAYLQQNDTLSIAQFRDLLATSRKVAVPLMEYFDLHNYTTREGDIRRIGPKLQNVSK